MTTFRYLSLFLAMALLGCASGHFSSSVKTIGVETRPQKEIIILAPEKANVFMTVAREHNAWIQAQLRNTITHQLSQSGRYEPGKGSGDDGQIVITGIRHGVLEVSPNNYAVQVVAEISLVGRGGKKIGDREITSTSGNVQPLREFEDSKTYEESLINASEKLALELVSDL
jgi:hypothetical protein